MVRITSRFSSSLFFFPLEWSRKHLFSCSLSGSFRGKRPPRLCLHSRPIRFDSIYWRPDLLQPIQVGVNSTRQHCDAQQELQIPTLPLAPKRKHFANDARMMAMHLVLAQVSFECRLTGRLHTLSYLRFLSILVCRLEREKKVVADDLIRFSFIHKSL